MRNRSRAYIVAAVLAVLFFAVIFVDALLRRPQEPQTIRPPQVAVTAWDQANWPLITRGYSLTTQTYELLPLHVPVDRLHCQSCHLDGAGNPTAAWWVGMRAVYTSTASLQARINGCFERSMNGSPLCTPAGTGTPGDCDANPDMMAFVTYMDWLDEQWQRQGLKTAPPLGFPPIARRAADPAHGAAIYEDKCGICHDPDGGGQYVGGVYAFPALWGPHSFNTSAGLAAHPQSMAAFIRWNMPYDAPGTLSDQEAWDLAAYVDAQPRPAGPAQP